MPSHVAEPCLACDRHAASADRFWGLIRPDQGATTKWTVEEAALDLLWVQEPQFIMFYSTHALLVRNLRHLLVYYSSCFALRVRTATVSLTSGLRYLDRL